MMELYPINSDIRPAVNELLKEHWFSTDLVIRGELVDSTTLEGFAVFEDQKIAGLITYRIKDRECEITSLDSFYENQGIGTELVNKVIETAKVNKCYLIKLITTNDNINALRFYQKRGFDMTAIYYNALEISRKLKPSIPLTGNFGIPIRHEIEFTMRLHNDKHEENNSSAVTGQTKIKVSPNDIMLYTDGSARGNPDGPGGYGTILVYVDSKGVEHEREYSAGYKKTTNNRMELMAAIVGLEALTKPCSVVIYSDSQYLVKAFNDNWLEGWMKKGWRTSQNDPVKNVDLWKRLLKAKEPHKVTFEWVRGHNGHPMNERCDKLATAAADGDNLLEDDITE